MPIGKILESTKDTKSTKILKATFRAFRVFRGQKKSNLLYFSWTVGLEND